MVVDPHLTTVWLDLVMSPELRNLAQFDSSDDLDAVRPSGEDAAGDDVDLRVTKRRRRSG